MPPSPAYSVVINPRAGGDRSTWAKFWCQRGGLGTLVDDERVYRTILTGQPVVIEFECEAEGRYCEQLVAVVQERYVSRPAAAALH
jgi:hypothetical protein